MFSLIPGIAMQALGQITKQLNIVQDIQRSVTGFMPSLQEAWVGEDANAFLGEMQTRFIPEVGRLIAAIAGMPSSFQAGIDLATETDSKNVSIAEEVGNAFDEIF
jgi:hypothetical protein